MEAVHTLSIRSRVDTAAWNAALLIAAAALLVSFFGLGVVLGRDPLPLPIVLGFGLGLLASLALALARFDTAVALGVLLLAVVRIEPAPSDLIFAVVIAVAFAVGSFDLERVPVSVITLVGAFLVLNLLSAIAAVDPGRAAEFFAITLYLGILALWLTSYVCSVRRARLVLLAYLTGAVASAAVACAALFVPFPGGEVFVSGPRAQGLFKDPNVFGPFLVPAALILMEETVVPRLLRWRLSTKLILLSILTIGIVFSFSRAAWLNLAVGTVVLLAVLSLRQGGGRKAFMLLAVGLVAAATLLGTLAATSSLEFLEQRATLQDYDAQRFGAQATGLEIATDHPIGIGPGQFEAASEISAHSTYVRALAEQGVLGVLIILGLAILTLGFAARNAGLGRDTYGIGSAALLAAWFGIVANSAFVDTLHWRHLWLVAALIWAGTALRTGYPGR